MLVSTDYRVVKCVQRGPAPSPLHTYIHLGVDLNSRRRTLSAIRDVKIQNGVDYAEARSRHLDLLQPYTSSEQYVDAQGNFCCSLFDVNQFTGVKSVRQVFNAAMFHYMNEEISISERLGNITVRDDFDVGGDNFINCRLSSIEDGVKTEVNTASFAQLMESESGDLFGVLVRDSVDVDEMHPYSPGECVRSDQIGVILLTPIRTKRNADTKTSDNEEEELTVVMRRCAFMKIHRPTFPLPESTQRGLLKGITAWHDVTLAALQSALSTSF